MRWESDLARGAADEMKYLAVVRPFAWQLKKRCTSRVTLIVSGTMQELQRRLRDTLHPVIFEKHVSGYNVVTGCQAWA